MAKCPIPDCVGRFNEELGSCEFHSAREIKKYFRQRMREAMTEKRQMSKKHGLGPNRCPICGGFLDEGGVCSNHQCALRQINATTF